MLDERYDEVDDIVRARRVPSMQLVGSPERATVDLNTLTEHRRAARGEVRRPSAAPAPSSRGRCATSAISRTSSSVACSTRSTSGRSATGIDDAVPPPHRFAPTRVPEPPRLDLDLAERRDPDDHLGDRLPPRLLVARRRRARRQGDGPARRWCRRRRAGHVPDRDAVPASTQVELHRRRLRRRGGPRAPSGGIPRRSDRGAGAPIARRFSARASPRGSPSRPARGARSGSDRRRRRTPVVRPRNHPSPSRSARTRARQNMCTRGPRSSTTASSNSKSCVLPNQRTNVAVTRSRPSHSFVVAGQEGA